MGVKELEQCYCTTCKFQACGRQVCALCAPRLAVDNFTGLQLDPLLFAVIGDTTKSLCSAEASATQRGLCGGESHWMLGWLVVKISRVPERKGKKSRIPCPILLEWQSNLVSRQDSLHFPESRTVFWSNLGSRKYPSGSLLPVWNRSFRQLNSVTHLWGPWRNLEPLWTEKKACYYKNSCFLSYSEGYTNWQK